MIGYFVWNPDSGYLVSISLLLLVILKRYVSPPWMMMISFSPPIRSALVMLFSGMAPYPLSTFRIKLLFYLVQMKIIINSRTVIALEPLFLERLAKLKIIVNRKRKKIFSVKRREFEADFTWGR